MTVSASPAEKDVAVDIVNVAVVAGDAGKIIDPTWTPFFSILNVAVAVADVPALAKAPSMPTGIVYGAENT